MTYQTLKNILMGAVIQTESCIEPFFITRLFQRVFQMNLEDEVQDSLIDKLNLKANYCPCFILKAVNQR